MRTILLITEPAEAADLRALLHSASGVHLRTLEDLDEDASPEAHLLRERPAALLLGTGALGVDVAAYLRAARQHLPGCVVCLLCDKDFARTARKLGPDRVLLRPVTGPEVMAVLRAHWHDAPHSAAVEQSIHDPVITIDLDGDDRDALQLRESDLLPDGRPASGPASLLRADDFLPDPLLLFRDDAPLPTPAPATARRRTSHTGEIIVSGRRSNPQRQRSPSAEQPPVIVDSGAYSAPLPSEFADSGEQPAPPPERDRDRDAVPRQISRPPRLASLSGNVPLQRTASAVTPVPIDFESSATPLPPPRPPSDTFPPVSGKTAVSLPAQQPPAESAPIRVESAATPGSARTAPPPLPPLSPGAEGDLQTNEPPALVGRLCTSGFTGCLHLTHALDSAGERNLFFEFGELCAATSSVVQDSLPELLYHEGRLSREQLKRARQVGEAGRAAGFGGFRLAQQLSQEQLLPKGEVQPLLRRHATEIFYRSFVWERGRYKLQPRTAPQEDRVQLREPVKLLLLEGLRRKAALDALLQRVGPDTTVLLPAGEGPGLLKDAGVTSFEQRALPLFDGHHSLAQVAAQSSLAEHATYVLAYALICLGGLRRPALLRASNPPRPPAPRNGAAHGTGSEPGRDTVLAWLRTKHRLVDDGDYFTLLGVPPGASGAEVKRAYEALRRELSAPALAGAQGDLGEQLREVRAAVDEAYGVLSDEQMRESYRAHLLPLQQP